MSQALVRLERLLPSLLMASGVMLLTVGALSFAPASSTPSRSPTAAPGDPLFGGPGTTSSAAPSAIDIGPSPAPRASLGGPRADPSRIRIASLGIDLPVIVGDDSAYPLCDVAAYVPSFAQPGEAGTTYIYAHAQKGMFLPLLRASLVGDGASMIGALVEVFTTDNQQHMYVISTVKRHATDLSIASGETEQLVLQTSEGPAGTVPKLQVAATPLSTVPAPMAVAQPSAVPRVCEPD
jgi:hypothetical protein